MKNDVKTPILIVDDDENQRDTLVEALAAFGEIHAAASGEEAKRLAAKIKPALVVTDLMLPGEIDGMGVLKFCRENFTATEVIMVTGHATVETALLAMKAGAYDYLTKPVELRRLRLLVQKALERYSITAERDMLLNAIEGETTFFGLVGSCTQMREVYKKIAAVAGIDSTVLVCGESGTGKELVAQALHKLSKREGECINVNCSAIPEHLLESELFGFEKGAFTGALKKKEGKFELANGGTLFLDEIGDMPASLQAKLLRALESGEIEILGASKPIKVDVRIVAATNQNLEKLIADGKFRADLYYRLRVFVINLPPLRERHGDIPLLISHFLKKLSAKLGKRITGVSKEVLDALSVYTWEGNVRQLKNALEEMCILAEDEILYELPSFISPVEHVESAVPIAESGTMDDLEKLAIEQTLARCSGNKTMAAKLLGIGLRTLYRKIEKYGIES